MAEKKPSKYSDRGTIGSAEELDAYGVWVKSEPQDLTASMAETVNFDAEAVPYADFDMEFDDSEESNYDFGGLEPEIPEINIESDDEIRDAAPERGSEEASTRLLMKIADELSAIRAELSTLKKEFAGVHIEGAAGVSAETRHGGFFDGEDEDDEKIAFTGEEMENFLSSADFSEGEASEEASEFDARREADEAALKELSAQNESAAETEEEIKIDFDNLGISLDDETEAETQDEFPPLESGADDDFETSSFDISSEETQEELASLEALEPLEPIEEDEELRDIRLEGAVPFTPAPDDSGYLEGDPFALDVSGLEETADETPLEETTFDETALEETALDETILDETALEETPFEESGLNESAVPEETVSQDASEITTDLSFDDVNFDLSTDDFSVEENLSPLEEETVGEQTLDTGNEINIEQTFESPAPLEEAAGDEQTFDTGSLDLSEAVIDEPDLSAGLVEAPLEEPVLGDISFGDDISLDMDDFGAGIDLDIQDSPAGGLTESLALDDTDTIDTGIEQPSAEEDSGLAEGLADDLVIDDSIELDTEDSGPAEGLADDLVIDESVELDTEDSGPTEGLTDDLTSDLALDDFGAGIDLDVKEEEPALADTPADEPDSGSAGGLADDGLDDGLTGIIPEGFEVNAEEAPASMDDDLEAFADDLAIDDAGLPAALPGAISLPETAEADAGGDIDIPANFKSELKSVLSYMDRLLESLPENKIEEFAKSEYFDSYKKIFKELGLV
jgi:hypothetical protein